MPDKYFCIKCNYSTNNRYNYNTHIKTSKHLTHTAVLDENTPKSNKKGSHTMKKGSHKVAKTANSTVDDQKDNITKWKSRSNVISCEYCQKPISNVCHRARHYQRCKLKIIYDKDQLIEQIRLEKERADQMAIEVTKIKEKQILEQLKRDKELAEQKAEEAIRSKLELEKDYREHVKTTTEILKNCGNTTINTNTNIDKRQMNIYYVIDTYKDAYNYDDIMSNRLTKAEKNHIRNYGPSAGCESLIMNRCVNGIPKDKRPFHCLDASREKFVYMTEGEWAIDLNGDKIMAPAMAQVRTQFDISDKNTDLNDRINSQRLLLDMDMNARKRTMKNLKKATLLKN